MRKLPHVELRLEVLQLWDLREVSILLGFSIAESVQGRYMKPPTPNTNPKLYTKCRITPQTPLKRIRNSTPMQNGRYLLLHPHPFEVVSRELLRSLLARGLTAALGLQGCSEFGCRTVARIKGVGSIKIHGLGFMRSGDSRLIISRRALQSSSSLGLHVH